MFDQAELIGDVAFKIRGRVILPVKVELHHRMGDRPVPVIMDVQPPEQFLLPLYAACLSLNSS